jgi:hypothetical protein
MIARVRTLKAMSTEERQAEMWAAELNRIYRYENPTCPRARELEQLLDGYWDDKSDWDVDELIAA